MQLMAVKGSFRLGESAPECDLHQFVDGKFDILLGRSAGADQEGVGYFILQLFIQRRFAETSHQRHIGQKEIARFGVKGNLQIILTGKRFERGFFDGLNVAGFGYAQYFLLLTRLDRQIGLFSLLNRKIRVRGVGIKTANAAA